MSTGERGLRARKKAATRNRIADVAVELFATHGYDAVTIVDVARAADVAEKTVYNYFPSKEHLVLDRDVEELVKLLDALRSRPRGTTPAQVVAEHVDSQIDGLAALKRNQIRGSLGYLAAINPGIRRACLDMIDRHAASVASTLSDEFPGGPDDILRIRLHAYAVRLCWVQMAIITESGRMLVAGSSPTTVATRLRLMTARLVGDLDEAAVFAHSGDIHARRPH